ncbi:MAG: aminotransferase class V-fold PLP-dependent enzyme, partial [Deltaproteobacteria bacterium]|nr:aminotransferase class V-fold PLP-dependent enzyme [Deltaproteobacteria bacterium]
NIVAASWGRTHLKAGDEVLVSVAEHHSNLVPWQMLCQSTGAALRFVELSADESVDEASVVDLIGPKTRIVALSMLSNVLGSSLEFSNISKAARGVGAIVCVDAAQAVAHQRIDVQAMGVDFVAFSGHKLFGPTGVGVLWGREELLLEMPPVWGGGQMIERVGRDSSTYAMPPHRFEAGTPPIGEVIGLGAAIEWLSNVGISNIDAHESVVLAAFRKVLDDEGVRVVGPKDRQSALLSFAMPGVHPHDLAQLFDSKGMCVRAGHHCAQPLMAALNEFALTRLSISPYTSLSDVERFRDALREARRFFG